MRVISSRDWLLLVTIFNVFWNVTAALRDHRYHRRSGLAYTSSTVRNSISAASHRRSNYKSSTSPSSVSEHSDERITASSLTAGGGAVSSTTSTTTWFGPELQLVRHIYDDCQDTKDFVGCLKQKAITALSRAIDKDTIKITDGVVLEKRNQMENESIIDVVTDSRTFSSLSPIDRSLFIKLDQLMRTHNLKFDMDESREGGKKKVRKVGHIRYVIAALMTAMGIAGPIGLKALAAIAVKALVISKVALTIAGIIALKKLFSHDHHEETSFQVHAGDHNRRSTFVIRPVQKATPVPVVSPASIDPYRYYYEYH